MRAPAVVLEEPGRLELKELELAGSEPDEEALVSVRWSGISAGTERLLWSGDMPHFPGLGYPLVPGYESVGQVEDAPEGSGLDPGDWVFVPGADCFRDARGLFGATAGRVRVPAERLIPLDGELGERGVLLALAATARHALELAGDGTPDLVIGHGALGRLLGRLCALEGEPPVVRETSERRRAGDHPYPVVHPDEDDGGPYRCVVDASGDPGIVDQVMGDLQRGGTVVLAGFYREPVSFEFPPAFLKEARLQVAAEWSPEDLVRVADLANEGELDLDGIISHRAPADEAPDAYRRAFDDPNCVKLILDWEQA